MTATDTMTFDWTFDTDLDARDEYVVASGDVHDRGVELLCVGEAQ